MPAYLALGQFSDSNLIAAVTLLPVAVLASLCGVRLVARVPTERFYVLMYFLLIATGSKLLWDGLAS